MRRFGRLLTSPRFLCVIASVLFFLLLSAAAQAPHGSGYKTSTKYAPDRILVKFRPGTQASARLAVHRAIGGVILRRFSGVQNLESVGLPSGLSVRQALHAYRQQPGVEYVEPDYVVRASIIPDDPLFPQQWNLLNTGQNGGAAGADIGTTSAWNLTTGSQNVAVAVIDTGIDYTHQDLAPNVWTNPAPLSLSVNGVSITCAAGTYGYNAITNVCDPMDDNGHGTHVSGTIGAAGNNGIGVVGVNWNVQLIACKFLNATGFGQVSDAITCLDFVLQLKQQGINIIATNNSWGGGPYSQALNDAIQAQQQAGILFISAAGNDFANNDIVPVYPANTSLTNVLSVAATTDTDAIASFSNTGKHTVHLGAPGQQILSTLPGDIYGIYSGTSMASPHVAGAAALLAAQNPSLDWRGIKNLLVAGGDPRSALTQTISGNRLNVYGAMNCAGKTQMKRLQPTNNAIAATPGTPVTLEELNINCSQPNGNLQVTVSPGGQIISLVDDGSSGDQVANDGVYTAQWIPPALGSYILTFPGGDIVEAESLSNYVVTPAAFNFRNISGTNLNLGDDQVVPVTSPFPITFGGGSFTQLQVGSNGTISFTDAYSPYFPTFYGAPVTLVAPFWTDLDPIPGTSQNVFWAVSGSAPNRELVVEWKNVRSFQCRNDPTATVDFQVVFSESSSDILFEYSDATFGGACAWENYGYDAAIGVWVAPQTGTSWSAFQQTIGDGTALLWTIPTTSPGPNPIPTITSLSPPTALEGGPSYTLTVNGSNFVPDSQVQWNGFDRVTTYISSTQLTAQISAADIAFGYGPTVYVDVLNPAPGGGQSYLFPYTIGPPAPVISFLSPSTVTAGSFSFTLTITGSGFAQGTTSVFWNGTLLQGDVVLNSGVLQIGVPYNLIATPGTVQITVSNSPTGGTSNPATLTVVPNPTGSSYPLPPPWNTFANPQTLLSAEPPMRFLGWKYASRGGPNYLQYFQRGRANGVISANAGNIANGSSSISIQSTTSPSILPGVQLRSLLPADFIPTAVAVGDFNGDGVPDWVVANGGSNNLWVYLGRGDGTFTQATVIPLTGQSPIAVGVGDLRGIGASDIVVAEADSLTIGVLLSNGDGTFSPETSYIVPGTPLSLALGDFNGDGHVDVAVGVESDAFYPVAGPLVLLPGNGAGSLGNPVYELAQDTDTEFPQAIVAGDFEKNGKPDIATVGENGLELYGNNGSGGFKFLQFVWGNPYIGLLTVAQGDVNEDGCPDLVVVDSLAIARVFLGNCDGTFQNQSNEMGLGDIAWGLALADVNGDGHLDLVFSGIGGGATDYGQSAGNLIGVLPGDGKGNFGNAQLYRGGQSSYGLAIADFNNDGHPDVIAANQNSDSVTLLLNNGHGGFGAPQGEYFGYVHGNNSTGAVNSAMTQFFPVDVDGDGRKDLVLIQFGPGFPNPYQATVMLNQGGGVFSAPILSPVLDGTASLADYVLADFRNTGTPDLLIIAGAQGYGPPFLSFVPNTGGGHFGVPQITQSSTPGVLAVGDFNNDGNLDFVVAGFVPNTTNEAQITVYLGHGDGTFTPQATTTFTITSSSGSAPNVWVGDFNRDGNQDLLFAATDGDVYELLGNGTGSFLPAKDVIQNVSGFVVADVNNDGLPDLIESFDPALSIPQFQSKPRFRIFLCQPDGSFVLNATYAPYNGWAAFPASSIYGTQGGQRFVPWIGDFNGDGKIDIAAIEQEPGSYPRHYYAQFLLGNGDGTFTPTYDVFDFNLPSPTTASDLNGDGITDMAELDFFTSSFHVILGGAAPSLQTQLVSDPVIGANGALHISLDVPSATGATISLSASDPAINIPKSVVITPGTITQNVNFTIGPAFNSSHVFSIQAQLGNTTSTAYGTQVTPGGQYGVAMYVAYPSQSTFPGGVTPDYQLGLNSVAGYATTYNLSCQGLPSGAMCQFGSSQIVLGAGTSVATSVVVSTLQNLPFGAYPFNIVGSDGNVSSTVAVTLLVGTFTVSITPSSLTSLSNTSAQFSLNISVVNNYSANLSATCHGIPSPAICNLASFVFSGANQITIAANGLTVGTYPFTVSVTDGHTTQSANAKLLVGDFSAFPSANSLSVAVGNSATDTIDVTGINGFSDPVSLACDGAPTGVTCSISPTSVTPSSGGTPAVVTVMVNSKPSWLQRPGRSAGLLRFSLRTCMAVAILFIIPLTEKRKRQILVVSLIAVILSIAGCGGGGATSTNGGGGFGGGGGGGSATTFNLTISATADNVTKNSTVQVTVP